MADQQKVVYGLSNGAIFNDPEQPLTKFSRSRHSLMLDISQTDKTYGHSYYKMRIETVLKLSNGTSFNDFE